MSKRKGFTLIELLVVIAIVALLLSIVLFFSNPSQTKARDSRRQADINQIGLAMELCLNDAACGSAEGEYFTTGTAVDNIDSDQNPCFLCPVSDDPSGGDYTWINNSSNLKKYCVYTKLESVDDTWIAVSHKGTCFSLTSVPSTLDCWINCP